MSFWGNEPALINFYTKGLLLKFTVEESWTYEEAAEKLNDAISANIKL